MFELAMVFGGITLIVVLAITINHLQSYYWEKVKENDRLEKERKHHLALAEAYLRRDKEYCLIAKVPYNPSGIDRKEKGWH